MICWQLKKIEAVKRNWDSYEFLIFFFFYANLLLRKCFNHFSDFLRMLFCNGLCSFIVTLLQNTLPLYVIPSKIRRPFFIFVLEIILNDKTLKIFTNIAKFRKLSMMEVSISVLSLVDSKFVNIFVHFAIFENKLFLCGNVDKKTFFVLRCVSFLT